MTTFNINESHSPNNRPNYQLGISKPTAKIPNYSSLDILRPENYDKYYTSVPTDFPTSYLKSSLNECDILFYGSGYPSSTTVSFDMPDDPSGTQASGLIYFGLTLESINLTHPGTGYQVNDTIGVFSDASFFPAFIEVESVDNSGSIVDYNIVGVGMLIVDESNPLSTISGNNNSAIFTFNDSYEIAHIDMIDPGNGYSITDTSGVTKLYEAMLSNEYGSGFIGYATTRKSVSNILYPSGININDNPRENIVSHTKYGLYGNYDKFLPSVNPTGILY